VLQQGVVTCVLLLCAIETLCACREHKTSGIRSLLYVSLCRLPQAKLTLTDSGVCRIEDSVDVLAQTPYCALWLCELLQQPS
jgi:hypothetical protein